MNRVHEKPVEVTATDLRYNIARVLRDAHYGIPTLITNNGEPFAKVVHPDAGVTPHPDVWQAAQKAYDAVVSGNSGMVRGYAEALDALGALLGAYYGYDQEATENV